jgi:hypothetical protein
VLELIVDESSDRVRAKPPVDADIQVTAHPDRVGEICAYTYTADGEHRIDLPELASFSFTATGNEVRAAPEPGARRDWIDDAYRRTVLPLALQAQGREVLHASAILTRGGVVGMCGKSGMGKSTLAYALARRGYQLWADDAVALAVGDDVTTLPLPFRVRLKGEAAGRFGARPAAENGLAIIGVEGPERSPSPLAALVALERAESGRHAALRLLSPREALPILLLHAFFFSEHDAELHRRMVHHYLEVAALVPMYELRVQPGMERLDQLCDSMETVLPDRRPNLRIVEAR